MGINLKIKYTLIIWISYMLLIFCQVDSIFLGNDNILLDEVVLESSRVKIEDQRFYFLLQRKVLKVYPYIDSLENILNEADGSIQTLKKKRHTRRYVRKFQKIIMTRFAQSITNLTRQEGLILSKLIYREFNITVYDLIHRYRGGVHAFFWQRISKLYDGNLKAHYNPNQNRQDFYIEHILQKSIEE